MRELFGDSMLAPDGAVDRGALAATVFRDPAALARLEAAIHPLVRDRFEEIAGGLGGIVVVEATRWWRPAGGTTWTWWSPWRPRRSCGSSGRWPAGWTGDEARRRLAAQGEGEARRRRADRVLVNDGDLDALREDVSRLVRDLRRHLHDKEVRG